MAERNYGLVSLCEALPDGVYEQDVAFLPDAIGYRVVASSPEAGCYFRRTVAAAAAVLHSELGLEDADVQALDRHMRYDDWRQIAPGPMARLLRQVVDKGSGIYYDAGLPQLGNVLWVSLEGYYCDVVDGFLIPSTHQISLLDERRQTHAAAIGATCYRVNLLRRDDRSMDSEPVLSMAPGASRLELGEWQVDKLRPKEPPQFIPISSYIVDGAVGLPAQPRLQLVTADWLSYYGLMTNKSS